MNIIYIIRKIIHLCRRPFAREDRRRPYSTLTTNTNFGRNSPLFTYITRARLRGLAPREVRNLFRNRRGPSTAETRRTAAKKKTAAAAVNIN